MARQRRHVSRSLNCTKCSRRIDGLYWAELSVDHRADVHCRVVSLPAVHERDRKRGSLLEIIERAGAGDQLEFALGTAGDDPELVGLGRQGWRRRLGARGALGCQVDDVVDTFHDDSGNVF